MIITKLSTWQRVVIFLAFAKALIIITSCKTNDYHLKTINGSRAVIDSTQAEVTEINNFITPYKLQVDAKMSEPLSYNPVAMHKNDFKYNTPIGNMLAIMMREQAKDVYTSRTGKNIDIVILNHGGIRAGLPAGNVTMRNAFEIMPFENEMMVATLNGNQVRELVNYLVEGKRAHPIDGLKIILNKDLSFNIATVNGKAINKDASYNVLTSDYLYNGGDNMSFFKDTAVVVLDYKIRNAMIDYLRKTDTLRFTQDDRFSVIK